MKIDSAFFTLRHVASVLAGLLFCGSVMAQDNVASDIFAEVGGKKISWTEFDAGFHLAARQRFFHKGVSQDKLDALRVEVAQDMIDKLLLLKEVGRRELSISERDVDALVAEERKRFRIDHMSTEQKSNVMSMLRVQAEETLLLERLEVEVKAVSDPSEKSVREFYQRNVDKFTTPEQVRVSVILLRVAPSATPTVWRAAHDEALRLLVRMRSAADSGVRFSELALIHSGDSSAENGGDLGFVHQGMLSAEAQEVVDVLAPNAISEPVMLLQGVALFLVTERKLPELNLFEAVQSRASGLWMRERSTFLWNELLEGLRAGAGVIVYDELINKKITDQYVSVVE